MAVTSGTSSPDRYLVGNRVYRGGSSAPTMGTVDPSGYIERELNKRSGMTTPTGMTPDASQTRSGLAQAALQRLGSMTNPINPTDTYGPRPTNAPSEMGQVSSGLPTGGYFGSPVAHGSQDPSALDTALQAKIAAVKADHANQVAQTAATRPVVSSTGKLSPARPTPPAAAPAQQNAQSAAVNFNNATALPYDYQGSMDQINATDVFGQLLNQLQAERQVAQRNYVTGMHGLDEQQPNDERGLLNQFGARGMAHSSGYGVGYGNLENQYAGERSGLADTLAQLMNQYGAQEAQGQGTYNQQLALIRSAIAQRLAQQAGSLGLGK